MPGKKRFAMPPAVRWFGRPFFKTLNPNSFSLAAILTRTRQSNWKERPLSKLISDQAGPTGRLGD